MERKIVPALSFDFLTPYYDVLSGAIGFGRSFKEKVIDVANIQDGDNIVDVGSGTGTLAILAKQKFPNSTVVGIDPDEQILKIAKQKAREKGAKVFFVKANAQKMPIDSNSIDVVVSSLIFHHLPTNIKKQAMREIHRILKRNGRFLLADFGKAEGVFFTAFSSIVQTLRLPEAKTMQDNIEGKIPIFLKDAGFEAREIQPPYLGVRFLIASKINR